MTEKITPLTDGLLLKILSQIPTPIIAIDRDRVECDISVRVDFQSKVPVIVEDAGGHQGVLVGEGIHITAAVVVI